MDYAGHVHRSADLRNVWPIILMPVVCIAVALIVLICHRPKMRRLQVERHQFHSDMLALARHDLEVAKRVTGACEGIPNTNLERTPAAIAAAAEKKYDHMRMDQWCHAQDLIRLCRSLVEDLEAMLAEATPESLDKPFAERMKERIVRTGDVLGRHLILLQGQRAFLENSSHL